MPRIIRYNYTKFHRNRTVSFHVMPEHTDRQTDRQKKNNYIFGFGIDPVTCYLFFQYFQCTELTLLQIYNMYR